VVEGVKHKECRWKSALGWHSGLKKSDVRVRKRTEAPDVSRPYLGQAGARRLSAAAPDHGGSWGMVLDSVYAAQRVSRNVRDATGMLLQFHLKGRSP